MPHPARPRIALVVPTFPKLSETFILRQALGLRRRGHDVHVLCRRFDRVAWSKLAARGELEGRIHVEPPSEPRWRVLAHLPSVGLTWLRRPGNARRVGAVKSLYFESALARLDVDLVHFEFGSLAPSRLRAAKRLGLRTVVSFRGFDLNYVGLDQPGYYDAVWREADALHLLGEDLWRRARRRGCPAEKPHALIPPAVDTDAFSRPTSPVDESASGPLKLLSVGRLEWKKGHDYALRALRLARNRGVDARLRVLGDGEMLGALCFLRHQLGLDEHVDFAGAVPHAQVRRELADADALVHLSISEGFGNAVLEAQAMAVPVLASDADGLPENVADGETGLIVARRDPEAAAEALRRLVDPAYRHRLGRAGRERVRRLFTPEREIDGFERLYRMAFESAGRSVG